MKNKLLILTIMGLIVAGVSVFIYPVVKAQISQTEVKPDNEALQIVNSHLISNTFYEGVKENHIFKSSKFNLTKAISVISKENDSTLGPIEEWYFMRFQNVQNVDDWILLSISKYKSPEIASEMLNGVNYSQGSVEITKDFGDEGIKGFDQRGRLTGVGFRKGNFTISIGSKSEELTKVFAENALKAIEGK